VNTFTDGAIDMTLRKRAILVAIAAHTRKHGYGPSYRDIASAVGLASISSVARYIRVLARTGYLHEPSAKARAVVLAEDVMVSRRGRVARVVTTFRRCGECEMDVPADHSHADAEAAVSELLQLAANTVTTSPDALDLIRAATQTHPVGGESP
jgi:SOS-response transcriptional repressor LexA